MKYVGLLSDLSIHNLPVRIVSENTNVLEKMLL